MAEMGEWGLAPRNVSKFLLPRMSGNAPVRNDVEIPILVHPMALPLSEG